MNEHHCLLCMGSNTNRFTQLSDARKVLSEAFPDIHFGELMETQAIGSGFHSPFSNQLARFTTTLSYEERIHSPRNISPLISPFLPLATLLHSCYNISKVIQI